jgi:hypothetical protein
VLAAFLAPHAVWSDLSVHFWHCRWALTIVSFSFVSIRNFIHF